MQYLKKLARTFHEELVKRGIMAVSLTNKWGQTEMFILKYVHKAQLLSLIDEMV